MKFKWANTHTIHCMGQDISLKNKRKIPWFKPWFNIFWTQINCVYHSIRSMFRVLAMYKFEWSIKHTVLFICKSRLGRFYNSWVIYVSSHKKRLLLCSLRPRISQNLLSVTPFNNLSLTQYTFKSYRFFFAVWTPSVSILYWFQLKWLAENNT